MNWSLEHYNLICYPESADSGIFRYKASASSFEYKRLFEYTESGIKAHYEKNLASLAELPALVVAETPPDSKSQPPAFLSRIEDVRKHDGRVYFNYQHLSDRITSREVFDSYLFDFGKFERSRTHWAVKEGDLIYKFSKLTERRTVYSKPVAEAIEILEEAPPETVEGGEAASSKPPGDKVFVVHGHDEEALTGVKGFLDKAGLESIVLRDEPNRGQTIIEKFLEYSEEVGFAIVLLTPDDIGGGSSDSYEELRPRARQNVIFELGFFIGKLGRERVCALFRQGVEIPSDYKGVLFVEFNERGKWQEEMIREMRGAGFLKGP